MSADSDLPLRRAQIIELLGGELPIPGSPEIYGALSRSLRRMGILSRGVAAGLLRDKSSAIPVSILQSGLFNAFAAEVDDIPIIAINAGLVLRLKLFFDAALSDNELFPLPPPEARKISYPEAYWSGEFPVQKVSNNRHLRKLASPVRQFLAQYAFEVAMDFVFAHELTHSINGHVRWINKAVGLSVIDELNLGSTSGLKGIDYQTLEYDADAQAAAHTIRTAIRLPSFGGKVPVDQAFNKDAWANVGPIHLKIIFFGLFSLFLLFSTGPLPETLDDALASTHPHPMIRMEQLYRAVLDVSKNRENLDHSMVDQEFSHAAKLALASYKRVTGKPHLSETTPRPLDLFNQFVPRIFNHWTTIISPQLLDLSPASNLPTYTITG